MGESQWNGLEVGPEGEKVGIRSKGKGGRGGKGETRYLRGDGQGVAQIGSIGFGLGRSGHVDDEV
jgi:hypothetical protein